MISVTIGIPAFNEQENILNLLSDVLSQKMDGFKIKKIVVASDGSSDDTVKVSQSLKSKIVTVIDGKKRIGKSSRLNQIISLSKTDVLIFLDADVQIRDRGFIAKIVNKINSGYDLVSARVLAIKPVGFIEKTLNESIVFQDNVNTKFENGDNVYTCHGTCIAFSKRFYSSLRYPNIIGEDAYVYFYCKQNGFKYALVKNAISYIKLPTNIEDHLKQSKRFINSQKSMRRLFKNDEILKSYSITQMVNQKEILSSIVRSPIYFTSYLLLNMYTRLVSQGNIKTDFNWDISASSKKLKR